AAELRPERQERRRVDEPETAQKDAGRRALAGGHDVRAPHPPRQGGERSAIARHERVQPLAQWPEAWHPLVRDPPETAVRAMGERAKRRGGARQPRAVGLAQLDSVREAAAVHLGEALGDFLRWRVIDRVAGGAAPARDPRAAEAALPVEDEERLAHRLTSALPRSSPGSR